MAGGKIMSLTAREWEVKLKNSKITKATFKSFVNQNRLWLWAEKISDFDGMADCVKECDSHFLKHTTVNQNVEEPYKSHSLGVPEVWLVGGGRDYFTFKEKEWFIGIECHNCCGRFYIAIQKGE